MEMWILALIVAIAVGGIAAKHFDQRRLDRKRKAYTLTFPSELEPERVISWLQAASGTLESGPNRIGGYRTLVLETLVNDAGLNYRLRVPWQQAEYIANQLQGLIPGIRCEPDDRKLSAEWVVASEWGESEAQRPLRIADPHLTAVTIISSLQPLEDGEELLLQWVLAPSREKYVAPYEKKEYPGYLSKVLLGGFDQPKEKVDEHRAKLAEVNYDAVLRLAVRAATPARAKYLQGRVAGAVRSVKGQNNRLVRRRAMEVFDLNQRVANASGVLRWPAKLTASELVALIAWPIGAMDVPGMPTARTRHMSASNLIPRKGIVIGHSTLPGKRPVAITQSTLLTHAWLVGTTGKGKSTVIENSAAQLMQEGAGFVMIEPSGDLCRKVLDLVPAGRTQDVVYLDPTDTHNPIGLNLMQGASPSMVTSYLTGVLEAAFGSGIQTGDILRNTIYTVAQHPGMTLYEVALILDDPEFRDDLTRGIQDEQLRRFWTRFEGLSRGEQSQVTEPVMRRLRALLVPEMRGIFGQSAGLDMKQVLAQSKIVIVNLAEGQIGESNAELMGSLVVARLWQEVQARSLIPEPNRTPFFLIADEFQRYIKLPTSFSEILAQARKYGLGCLLAHQHLGQIGNLKQDVLTNALTKIVLGTAREDAATIAKELGLRPEDILNLDRYEAIVRMVVNNQTIRPATVQTLPSPRPLGVARAVREASKRLYGKPMAEVEQEMKARRAVHRRPVKARPKLADGIL